MVKMDLVYIPGSVQGQGGQDLAQPGVVQGVPTCDGGWNKVFFRIFSKPNQFVILWFSFCFDADPQCPDPCELPQS